MADKPKRKGLMAILADYQREEKQKREYSAEKKPNLSEKASKAKSNTKIAYSGESLMTQPKKKEEKKEEKKKNPPKTPTTPTRYRQQASTTRDNRNRGMTGYGYTGGRGGSIRDKNKK